MKAKYPEAPILIVEDEESILVGYEVTLANAGITNIVTCSDSRSALDLFLQHRPELVLLDLVMPHVSGYELLPEFVRSHPETPVILITGNDQIESAVDCMKAGAYDYLLKPIYRERLIATVKQVLSLRGLQKENAALRDRVMAVKLSRPDDFSHIVTASTLMHSLFAYVEAIAKTVHPVLITGETGVGKELFAGAVHKASLRLGRFVSVNVAGVDDNVFADTLFGHRKGAFTGADGNRAGMIEEAAGGSLFLDEIGDLSPLSQAKLLRLLQEHEYLPLGADRPVRSEARVIVATNADVKGLLAEGKFRPDLYYRLSTHRIHVPPLRERKEDLPLLLDYALKAAAQGLNKPTPVVPKEIVSLLNFYDFPGNVRELMAMVNDAVSRHTSKIMSLKVFKEHIDHHGAVEGTSTKDGTCGLPCGLGGVDIVFGEHMPALRDAKRLFVEEALRRSEGNLTRAAELLGTTRQALSWHKKRG